MQKPANDGEDDAAKKDKGVRDYRLERAESDIRSLRDEFKDFSNRADERHRELMAQQKTISEETQKRSTANNGVITFLTGITIFLLNRFFNWINGSH